MITMEEIALVSVTVPNNCIACEPFASLAIQTENRTGFVMVKQRSSLLKTKVIFGNGEYVPGDEIYISAQDTAAHPYCKEVFEAEGFKFILVPVAQIRLWVKVGR
jgi:hypothetical protein